MDNAQEALNIHKKFGGKISTALRDKPTAETLKLYYTPGVGAVSQRVADHPESLRDYTWVNNLVAVISDGSSVLGLGNIGPRGALPVMEGKAMLFKHFAELINAAKVTARSLANCKIVLIGAGAAGVAIAKLLHLYARPQLIAVDSTGIVHAGRNDLNEEKLQLAAISTNATEGTLKDALAGADIVIGISRGKLTAHDIKLMAKNPIVFALANPTPEIMPAEAVAAGAAVVTTGRSDFPNQVNNALAFPGIFRGALDNHIKTITDQHKIAAAQAIAGLLDAPTATNIMPSVFDDRLVPTIARVIV